MLDLTVSSQRSFVSSWQSSMRVHERMAENRMRFSQRLNEMGDELNTLVKEVEKNRKQVRYSFNAICYIADNNLFSKRRKISPLGLSGLYRNLKLSQTSIKIDWIWRRKNSNEYYCKRKGSLSRTTSFIKAAQEARGVNVLLGKQSLKAVFSSKGRILEMYHSCYSWVDPWFICFFLLDPTPRRWHTVTAINSVRPVSKSSYRNTGYETGVLQFPTSSNITGMLHMFILSHYCSSYFCDLGFERVCWRNWSRNTIPSDTICLPIWKHRLERWVNFSSSKRRRYVKNHPFFLKLSDQVANDNRTGVESYYRKDRQPWWFQDIYAELCFCTRFSTTSRSASGRTFRRRFRESTILFVISSINLDILLRSYPLYPFSTIKRSHLLIINTQMAQIISMTKVGRLSVLTWQSRWLAIMLKFRQ